MHKRLGLIVGFLMIFAVFSSSIIIIEHSATAKPFKFKKNGIFKKIEKIRKHIVNNEIEDQKRKDTKDEEKKHNDDKSNEKQTSNNYDYNFAAEGDNKRKNFNFAAVGDMGCSKNAKNTVNNIENKRPELVLPLGDLSYDPTATCWLDLV